jgi:NAD-dependent histone deacetylase SIR2
MPTLQIKPDAPDLLQNVADTLAKARKMVIITGAGISTNSGIPVRLLATLLLSHVPAR